MTQTVARPAKRLSLIHVLLVLAVIATGTSMPTLGRAQSSRSIKDWVSCDPKVDQRDNAAKAFAAAANNAFTLVIDCPVFIHVGQDIGKPIFLDSGLHVTMTTAGSFIIDNVFVPTFVMADSKDIQMTDWNILYVGSMPTDPRTGGYSTNGVFTPSTAVDPPSAAFNDNVITPWLAAHRGIVFSRGVKSPWTGPTNAAASFRFIGDTSQVSISNMRFHAAPGADVAHLIPVGFDVGPGYRAGVQASSQDPGLIAIPSKITVDGLILDGAYMGWVGELKDSSFNNIRSVRYGDLQGADNANLGGVGKWFAPPHLFYFVALGSTPTDNIKITNVLDKGERLGIARDTSAASLSGYALSLKIGANNSTVSNYVSHRPDGLLDVLQANNMTISNVQADYNSDFLNDLFSGIRFPASNLHNVTLSNIQLTDNAPVAKVPPISNMTEPHSDHIVLKAVTVTVHALRQGISGVPTVTGAGSSVDVKLIVQP